MTLSTSHWPADFSQPVVDVTVGDALRAAAADDARFALQHIEYAAPDILRAGYALAVASDR